ncbi:MAG: YDG domain-containing protein, partial [Sphaerochaeta sp.]|nr:YDG domain-containing protein [Sphaerochaeta sp.]
MKKTTITLLFIATILLSFTACSDMMEKLGNINLTIVLDTPDIAVASYRLEGLHDNPNSRFTVHDIVPPRHTLSSLKSGLWTITVTAFDAAGTQLGAGTTRINLREGQIVETTLLVVFSQDAPTSSGFTFSAPTRFDSADGRMSGTTAAMEYRLATDPADAPYTACSEGTTILGTGTYLIRYAAAHGLRASDPLSVTVPLYQPIQLTIADPTLNTNKTYDGTVEITGSATAGALVGIVGTDDVTINTLATYDNKAAGSGKIITVTYTLGGPDAGNYIKPVDTVVIGVIEKRQLTISGTTIAATKIYDRSPLTTVTSPGMLGGVIGSDEVTVAPTASCTDSNVGNDKPVTITYTLGGRDGGNYLV